MGFIFLLPKLQKSSWGAMGRPVFWMRTVLAIGGSIFWIYGLKAKGLLYTVSMGFITPFATIVGAKIFLGESLHRRQMYAIFLAILASFLMTSDQWVPAFLIFLGNVFDAPRIFLSKIHGEHPGVYSKTISAIGEARYWHMWAPSLASGAFGLSNVCSKVLLREYPSTQLTGIFLATSSVGLILFMSVVLLGFLPFGLDTLWLCQWIWPTKGQWYILVVLGGLMMCAQLGLYGAIKESSLISLLPLGGLRLIFSAFLGWVYFLEVPSGALLLGVCVSIFSMTLVFWDSNAASH